MGAVYRARDTRLDRDVAIKVLPDDFARDEKARQRFEREAKAISRLSHPNVCTLFDIGSENGVDFLVLEYLEGETLAQRLRRGRLSLDELKAIGAQIAEGIEAAHRRGLVHRDLEPGNVMLTADGAKVMDFGLAKGRNGGPRAASRACRPRRLGRGRVSLLLPFLAGASTSFRGDRDLAGPPDGQLA